MPQAITLEDKKTVIGYADKGVLRRKVSGKREMLRGPAGRGMEDYTLHEAEKWGCAIIRILDTDTNKCYEVGISVFKKESVPIERKRNAQHSLALTFWKIFGADRLYYGLR